MPPEYANDPTIHQQPRCEFGKTLFAVGECQRFGEVQLDGTLLCSSHAKLVRLQVRETTLLSQVFELDKWLDTPSNQADRFHWRRMLRERDKVIEELRFNRTLIESHKELDEQL